MQDCRIFCILFKFQIDAKMQKSRNALCCFVSLICSLEIKSFHFHSYVSLGGPEVSEVSGRPNILFGLWAINDLVSQNPRLRSGDPPNSLFQLLECGKLITTHYSVSFRAGRRNDRPVDPQSLQLWPSRLGWPPGSHEDDRRLLS